MEKIDISYGVRNARYLSVERQNRLVAHTLSNYDFLRQLSWFCYSLLPVELKERNPSIEPEYYNLRPGGIFYRELDLHQRQYLIYVLKPI